MSAKTFKDVKSSGKGVAEEEPQRDRSESPEPAPASEMETTDVVQFRMLVSSFSMPSSMQFCTLPKERNGGKYRERTPVPTLPRIPGPASRKVVRSRYNENLRASGSNEKAPETSGPQKTERTPNTAIQVDKKDRNAGPSGSKPSSSHRGIFKNVETQLEEEETPKLKQGKGADERNNEYRPSTKKGRSANDSRHEEYYCPSEMRCRPAKLAASIKIKEQLGSQKPNAGKKNAKRN